MKFQKYPPPLDLQALVVDFWSLEIPKHPSTLELRLFAQALPEIVFIQGNLIETMGRPGKLNIYGSLPNPQTLFSKGMRMLGATLFPPTLAILFKVPPQLLYDTHISAVELLGEKAQEAEEKLSNSPALPEQINILADLLRRQMSLPSIPKFCKVLPAILEAGGQLSPEQLAESAGLSRRHFERKFRELSGLSPAFFCRLAKFRKAINLPAHTLSLTEIGLESGYYDQSHFIRDFKKFAGLPPKSYFHRQAHTAENLVPLP